MTDELEARRVLYCLVNTERDVFKVTVSVRNDIGDLKRLIYQVGIDKASKTHHKRLTLWKVSMLPMLTSILQLTTLGRLKNHYLLHPLTLWSNAYGGQALTSHNLQTR